MVEITAKIRVTPRQLAGEFADMNSGDQAKFFSCLAQEAGMSTNIWTIQLRMVGKSEYLTDEGRRVMALIGQYAEKMEMEIIEKEKP